MNETSTPRTTAPEPDGHAGATTPGVRPRTRRDVFGRSFATVWSNGKAKVGIILLLFFVLLAVFAPLIAPYGPTDNDFTRSQPPSVAHWLGTTAAGEDVLSQVVFGARISVSVGLIAGGLATVIALVIGLSWGYLRGWVGESLSFIVNLFLVMPALPLMIVIAAYLQNGGLPMVIAVIVITGWAWGARVLRSQTETLRSRDFVTAAQFSGDRGFRIVMREILPNMTSVVAGSLFGAATAAIIAEAGLSFLGIGDTTEVSWGTMLFWAQNSSALLLGQWGLLLAPGLCIALLAMSFTLINFGVDGLSNPRLREGKRK